MYAFIMDKMMFDTLLLFNCGTPVPIDISLYIWRESHDSISVFKRLAIKILNEVFPIPVGPAM